MANDLKQSTLQRSADIVGLAVAGLDVIAGLTKNTIDDKAVDILSAIRVVIATVIEGSKGTVTVERAHEELRQLQNSIAANDAAADDALAKKFDVGD